MKNLIFAFLFLFLLLNLNAQKVKIIENEKICEPGESDNKIEYVDTFKDSLKLTIDIKTITIGKKSEDINFKYSEIFQSESSIIQLSKKGAIRVSIARVIENGKKYYLYKIHLYKEEDNCWDDISAFQTWDCKPLGILNWGYGIGNQGTSNYIGYSGTIKIE